VEFVPRDEHDDRAALAPDPRRVQMVFQNAEAALNPRHTVRRMLSRSLQVLGGYGVRALRERRLGELADAVRLAPVDLAARPGALSGGMKQRVAIARAFAGSPELVVCDEPVSDLDVSVQAAILELLRDLQRRSGIAYLFISHDLGVVRYLADRIGVLYLGTLVEQGDAAAVFEPPHHPYTEALLSAVPALAFDEPRARIELTGPPPSASAPPSGCPFHTRCPRYLGPVCRDETPPWQHDGDAHAYRCHIPPDELRAAQAGDLRAGRAPRRRRSVAAD
jgi:peptide/nickel transport system ATP-binding protein